MQTETTILQAIQNWKKHHEAQNIQLALQIDFRKHWWPIKKMDQNLNKLKNCQQLLLDTNQIERIQCLDGLKHLTYLSLEMNRIKSLHGLDAVAKTLQVLKVSCNLIHSTKGIENLNELRTLHISNNCLVHWIEFQRLICCESLIDLSMAGNKFNRNVPLKVWKYLAKSRNPRLQIIENEVIVEKIPRIIDLEESDESCEILLSDSESDAED